MWKFKLVHVVLRFLPLKEEVRINPSKSVFLATAPGAEIAFGLALAAAVLDVELHQEADVLAVVEKKNVNRIAKAVDKALKLSNQEFDEMEQANFGQCVSPRRRRASGFELFELPQRGDVDLQHDRS